MTTTLFLGQAHANLRILETTALKNSSPKEKVMPKEVLDLFFENYILTPGSFEQFRAKSISLLIGVTLPFAILAIAGYVIYKATQSDIVIQVLAKVINTIASWANQAFTAISKNSTNVAVSAVGIALATFTLTRPGVREAFGSFFGSLFGSLFGSPMGSGISGIFKISENTGYHWWYDKYRFTDRIKQIQENNESIIHILKTTYDEMAFDLNKNLEGKNLKQDSDYLNKLKKNVSTIRDRLPVIHAIFRNNGIHENQCSEITLSLSEAIGAVDSFGED